MDNGTLITPGLPQQRRINYYSWRWHCCPIVSVYINAVTTTDDIQDLDELTLFIGGDYDHYSMQLFWGARGHSKQGVGITLETSLSRSLEVSAVFQVYIINLFRTREPKLQHVLKGTGACKCSENKRKIVVSLACSLFLAHLFMGSLWTGKRIKDSCFYWCQWDKI